MRNDPEFCFYGRKYDDSRAGSLDDEDSAPIPFNAKEEKSPEAEEIKEETSTAAEGDEQVSIRDSQIWWSRVISFECCFKVYVWPSKADIGMRLRRIIAAFLREQASDMRKRKIQEKEQRKERDKRVRLRERESRQAQRQRARQQEASNRWSKKNKADFLRTILSFGIETHPNVPDVQWARFKEIAGLEKKTDESLDLYLQKFIASCEEVVKRHQQEQAAEQSEPMEQVEQAEPLEQVEQTSSENATASTSQATSTEASPFVHQQLQPQVTVEGPSRASSVEPQGESTINEEQSIDQGGDREELGDIDLVPYDKARRALKRIEQMKKIREQVMVHPALDELLLNARRTSGLPS